MARPHGAPKPQARNRPPRRTENREHLTSLTSEVLRLRLQALNLPITGSKAQLVKRLQNTFQPTQRPLVEASKQTGRVQKDRAGKGKTRVVRPAVAQPDPNRRGCRRKSPTMYKNLNVRYFSGGLSGS